MVRMGVSNRRQEAMRLIQMPPCWVLHSSKAAMCPVAQRHACPACTSPCSLRSLQLPAS